MANLNKKKNRVAEWLPDFLIERFYKTIDNIKIRDIMYKNFRRYIMAKCPECGGAGTVDCWNCGGRGYFKCTCGGNAGSFCQKCNGVGEVDCETCGGDGKLPCKKCGGSGTVSD